jgi:hypothetical protein
MKAVQEVTQWDLDYNPNHKYLLDGDRVHAFMARGATEPTYYKTPLRIDTRGRKFMELQVSPFTIQTKSNLIKVMGSKGDTYWVDPDKGSCSCSGFKFRGTCKHIQEVLQ